MKKNLRALVAWILTIGGWLALMRAAFVFALAIFQIDMAQSMAEDDAAIVTTRLIPHLTSPKNHLSLLDLANGRKVSSQVIADALSLAEWALLVAGLYLGASLLCWLLLRWFFPDRKELMKPAPIPDNSGVWQRPLKLWRSREIK
jgi:hypothetical protein